MRLSPALVVAAVACTALPAAAQDPRLPSLTPGVFTSVGTAPRVALQDIERQPLTGFGPPPRSYVVPAERQPAVQPFAPDLDGLPALALAPPPTPEAAAPVARALRLEGGGGAQYARYGRLDLVRAGDGGRFYLDAAYDGVGRSGPRETVAGDRLDVRAGGQSFAPGRLRLDASLAWDTYDLLGASVPDRRRRTLYGAEAGLEGVGLTPYAVTLGFTQSRLALTDGRNAATEGRVDGRARVGLAGDLVRLDVAGGAASDGGFGTDVVYGQGGAALALVRPADGARLVLGVRALAYDATALSGGGDSRTLGPIVDVELPVGASFRAFATNDPHLAVRSLAALAALNPFVASNPVVAPDVRPVDARAGVEVRRGVARVRAFATALYAPTYLVFESSGALFAEDYVSARAGGLGADVTLARPDGLSASAGVEVRRGETEAGGDLPFFAPVVARAGLQTPFASGRGRAGLALYAEGPRPADRGGSRADAWGTLSLDARYDVRGPFALALRAERLVGSAERWPGFPEPPYAVMLGLRLAR